MHAVDIEEQERGKNKSEHDHNWMDAKAKQVERQGQSAMHGARSSSIYSRTPLPVVSDERKAHSMFSPISQVPRFNEPRLSRLWITGTAHEAGISKGRRSHSVNTAAIELNSRRPSLDEDGGRSVTLIKEPHRPQSEAQLSASQGTWWYNSGILYPIIFAQLGHMAAAGSEEKELRCEDIRRSSYSYDFKCWHYQECEISFSSIKIFRYGSCF